MENISIWDQKNRNFIRRGFSSGKITIEFDRTKKFKIAEHTLAEINFDFKKELNNNRNQVISRDIKKVDSSGFKYESIGNVYSPEPEVIKAEATGEFRILSHGASVPGDLLGGNENCAIEGLTCTDGTNTNCKPGKCLIGRLRKISNFKWKYTSESSYNGSAVEYFVGGKEVIELKTIIRGTYKNIDGSLIEIDKPASKATTIFLPPVNYLEDIFSEDTLKIFNSALSLDGSETLSGIITPEEDFIVRILKLAYKNISHIETGPRYSSLADTDLSEEVYTAVEDALFKIDEIWKEKISEIMTQRWENRFANHETNRQFISFVFREFRSLFLNCLQITRSGLKQSKIRSISDENTRPIYLRLPSASLSYRPEEAEQMLLIADEGERLNISISALEIGTVVAISDRSVAYQFLPRTIYDEEERRALGMSPVLSDRTKSELYSPKDIKSWYKLPEDRLPKAPVAKWILAGADEFLREKKHEIDSFYYTYLDPNECSPKNLDWLAQHAGLTRPFWNVNWDEKYKRTLIRNALGWFEEELSQTIAETEYKTIKGEVLDLSPFDSSPWRSTEEITDGSTDLSNIDLASTGYSGNFSVDKAEWNGLMESKGSILSLVFLFSLFNVKAHTKEEVEKNSDGTFKVKSGLRENEINAPTLLPTKFTLAQVGTEELDSLGNRVESGAASFRNQLIAGETAIASLEDSNNMFFRLPFYYNRNGQTWGAVQSISEYWTESKLNSRVQYAFLAADLWRQGDAFFNPEIIDESIDNTNKKIQTLDGNNHLVSQNSLDIFYN